MKELLLKYGCNPNQSKARIYSKIGELPIEVLNGRPGYINSVSYTHLTLPTTERV